VQKRLFDCPAACVDGGFNYFAALDNGCFNGIQAGFDHRFNRIQAALNDVLDPFAAFFDNRLGGLATSEDRVFNGACHPGPPYLAPAPGTGSTMIFIESG
jgi:hypothetical protein